MTEGLSAVLSRISQIQALINPAPVQASDAVTETPSGTSTSGSADFDNVLDQLNGGTTGTGASTSKSGGTQADRAISIAKQYLGVNYKWGGNDPETGLDCSGFTKLVYGQLGVDLPRTSAAQATTGTRVSSMAAAKPGDLVFFGSPVHHVGIYLGDGNMIDAPKAGEVVQIRKVYETPSQIRRVLPDSTSSSSSADAAVANTLAKLTGTSSLGSTPYANLFTAAGKKYGLDPALLSAVAKTESNYNVSAKSPAGALGLMQLMPGTAAGLGVDPMVPSQAVDGAARLLSDHLRTFGRVDLALAAYNAGPGAVRKYDGVPPYTETENYVRRVQKAWGQLR